MDFPSRYIAGMVDSGHTNTLHFMKMHGAGNDFVIFDSRGRASVVTSDLALALGDRHFGVGFDQLVEMRSDESYDIALNFWNSDGSRSAACGNATRCVAGYLMAETKQSRLSICTGERVLSAHTKPDGSIWVNMGQPVFSWSDIPLSPETGSRNLPLPGAPDAVGMGNPHCVFFVEDAEATDIETLGPRFETDPIFPEATNVEWVQILAADLLRVKVWERGTGVTLACGSGACAALVAARQRGLCDSNVTLEMDGGMLAVDWRDDGVWLSGPTSHVFDGVLAPDFLGGSDG